MKTKIFEVEKKDIVALFAIFISMFILCRIGIIGGFGIGFSIGCAITILVCFIYVWKKEARSKGFSILLLLLGMLLVSSFSLHNDNLIKFCTIVYLPFFSAFLMCNASDNADFRKGTYKVFVDAILKTFDGAFLKLEVTLRSFIKKISNHKSKNLGYIIIGVLISIPLLCLVLPLLSSSDIAFGSMLRAIFKNVGLLVLALILTIITFPAVYSGAFSLKKQSIKKSVGKVNAGEIPCIILNIVLGAVSVVYCAYAFSQLAYITKAFAFLLPADYTAAEFARSGFFQMGVISFINFVILALTAILVKRTNKKIPKLTKALLGFVCLFTIFYIVTAIIKMVMYISLYGLTHLRVLTSVFMLMLVLIFAVLFFRLLTPKIKYAKAIVVICTAALLCVSVVDTKTVIAEYNYEQYKSGKIDIDVEQIATLGIGGIPTLVKLSEDENKQVAEAAQDYLYYAYDLVYERVDTTEDGVVKIRPIKAGLYEKNLSWIRAKVALEGYTEKHPQVLEDYFLDNYLYDDVVEDVVVVDE